ncbi:hypothetical protein NKR23_g12104 [Pleurostoma richardsiae]|uniref:Uncharacterized protein n=1 Tax=Pleurostoma richardsiae TaxID=41990 RepID=A0AA38R6J9_9PEZI|nr:hypothetical protein NKR23_g12104 [Pleurostoma richardsiae]
MTQGPQAAWLRQTLPLAKGYDPSRAFGRWDTSSRAPQHSFPSIAALSTTVPGITLPPDTTGVTTNSGIEAVEMLQSQQDNANVSLVSPAMWSSVASEDMDWTGGEIAAAAVCPCRDADE